MSFDKEKIQRVTIAALWVKETRDGSQYMQGPLGRSAMVQIWPNSFKRGPNDPDYNLVVCTKMKLDQPKDQAGEESQEAPWPEAPPVTDDECPF
jgi:hypothetical protein